MRRLVLTTALIAAVAVLAVLLVIRTRGGAGDSVFSTGTGSDITKVTLERPDVKVILENRKGEWVLNRSGKARMPAVMLLLATLEEMNPRSAVSADIFNRLSSGRHDEPVKVTAFAGRKRVTSFWVYHFSEPGFSSVLKRSAGAKPYLVYLPGYDFDPGMVFTTDEDYWKPFTLFEIMPSAIKEVMMKYSSDSGRSFTIVNEKGSVSLTGSDAFDTVAVKRYLSYFVKIPFESLAEGLSREEEQTIISGTSLFSLSVITVDGERHVLTGWRRSGINDSSGEPDTDRLWGRLDDGPLVVMRYLDIDPVLKKRSYFLPGK